MQLTFGPKGVLQIDDARIIFRNFAGEGTKYNREGDRNFAVIIETQEQYDALMEDVSKHGIPWNVKPIESRDEGDAPVWYLPVKVKYKDGDGPMVRLVSGAAKTKLTERSIAVLDDVDIVTVNMDIRPYDGEVNGKPFRSAYLKSIKVWQEVDRLADEDEFDDLDRED